jgi:hypothetical protein
MAPITYQKKLKLTWKDDLLLVSASMFLLGLAAAFNRASAWPPVTECGADQVLKITVLLLCLLGAAGFFRLALPRHNSLRLDQNGVTYQSAGHSGIWPWHDISPFTLARGWRGPSIRFTVSKDDDRWRISPLRRTKAGSTGTIPDIWDTPLENIAATLNEYRDRALEGRAATARPKAPAD